VQYQTLQSTASLSGLRLATVMRHTVSTHSFKTILELKGLTADGMSVRVASLEPTRQELSAKLGINFRPSIRQ